MQGNTEFQSVAVVYKMLILYCNYGDICIDQQYVRLSLIFPAPQQ